LIISSLGMASSFTKSFSKTLTSVNESKSLPLPNNHAPTALLEADVAPEHLEPLMKIASRGADLTTSQIANLLSVSASFITKNPVNFDYEGFRFTRSGRVGRQISWKVEYLGSKT
jgi:hypothetical protein